eukprot:7823786-Pyramimonas_sp.AAC.1
MGWSRALRLCREMVAASVQKRPAPDLTVTDAQVAAAVYVDNAAIAGTGEKRVTVAAGAVFRQLEAD